MPKRIKDNRKRKVNLLKQRSFAREAAQVGVYTDPLIIQKYGIEYVNALLKDLED